MAQSPEISVIVVTYNQEDTISRTLDSILEQDCNVPFEIVIGDDCSTDLTEQICRSYAQRYPEIIRYFRRDPNIGVMENYFRCIEESRGHFLADCAGDDFWVDKNKLQKQYDILKGNPDVSLVHTDWQCYNPEKNIAFSADFLKTYNRTQRIEYEKGILVAPILRHDNETTIHLCSAMYRRDIIIKELEEYPEIYRSPDYTCEDLQITAAMAANGKIVFLPDVTLYYTISSNSLSHNTDFTKKIKQIKGSLLLTERLSKRYHINTKENNNYISSQFDYLAAQVFHSADKELKEEYFKLKKEIKPTKIKLKTRFRELIISTPILWKPAHLLFSKSISR